MSHPRRQQRGPYATMACINCRRRHAKCSEEATCTYCASHSLKCIYVKSGEEPQLIQSGVFPNQVYIDTNYMMPNNSTPINFSDTFPLLNNSFSSSFSSSSSSSSSIATNLDYLNWY
ncbi:fungal-specific transcription factor domain protein [Gigaspora margarita]|uniref:Fungal-specific transcription factor domain protein n=1 Tax=Gigaspora margarita TaxID=4874 RepID=A0A8H3XAT2_GIGMA|nr:fungal-specific transcription factor domain protein [Gigaspora margarita]